MNIIYLLDVVKGSSGVVLEWKIEKRKKDKRTTFYRKNYKNIVEKKDLEELIKKFENRGVVVKGNFVVMPNGKVAFEFGKKLNSIFEKLRK